MQRGRALSLLLLLSLTHHQLPAPAPAPAPDEPAASRHREAPPLQRWTSPSSPEQPAPMVLSGRLDQPAYISEQVLIAPAEGASLGELAARWGAELVREVGRSGYGALSVPDGATAADFRAALRSDPDVQHAGPMGRTRGAGSAACSSGDPLSGTVQWHHATIGTPTSSEALARYTVAVLDTGAAYADDGGYAAAPSLASVPIVAPWDFVNDDALPYDDHQHGTHISSLVVGQGSAVQGVAAGAQLMPVKVLDHDNSGSELDLIEGIYWAVDSGADVINMSLSFSEQYAPSAALLGALEAAWGSGVVMIAAAGNDGAKFVSWPAASPRVIAVGAGHDDGSGQLAATGYSNRGAAVDLLAPGGDLSQDRDADGLPDGIIAESFPLKQPGQIGLWMFAGTSQAAALASGAALWSLASGATPEAISGLLQDGDTYSRAVSSSGYTMGVGAGSLAVDGAVLQTCEGRGAYDADRLQVAALPWLARLDARTVAPRVRLTVLERADGAPAAHVTAYVNFSGDAGGVYSCKTDAQGACTVALPGQADDDQAAWMFSVDTVVDGGVAYHPAGVLFGSDALEITLQALSDAGASGLLAWHWPEGSDATLGKVAESLVAVNGGTGLSSSPLGTIFKFGALGGSSSQGDVVLDLDGTGLASSPLGTISLPKLTVSADDLVSGASLDLIVADATGADSPALGLSALSLHAGLGAPLDDRALAHDGTRIDLLTPAAVRGSATDAWAQAGGFQLGGYPIATALVGASALSVPAEAAVSFPTGDGSIAVPTSTSSSSTGGGRGKGGGK